MSREHHPGPARAASPAPKGATAPGPGAARAPQPRTAPTHQVFERLLLWNVPFVADGHVSGEEGPARALTRGRGAPEPRQRAPPTSPQGQGTRPRLSYPGGTLLVRRCRGRACECEAGRGSGAAVVWGEDGPPPHPRPYRNTGRSGSGRGLGCPGLSPNSLVKICEEVDSECMLLVELVPVGILHGVQSVGRSRIF